MYTKYNKMKKIITLFLIFIAYSGFSQNPEQKIKSYLQENRAKLDLTALDINDWYIQSTANSESTGINNYYVKQRHQGIEVFRNVSNFWIKNGEVINGGEGFVSNANSKVNTTTPTLNVLEGFARAISLLNENSITNIMILENNGYKFKLSNGTLVNDPVRAELVYQIMDDNSLRLAWDYNFYNQSQKNMWSVRIDAVDGKLLEKNDMVISCSFGPSIDHSKHKHSIIDYTAKLAESFTKEFYKPSTPLEIQSGSYRVFPRNIESPNHGARQLLASPHNTTASPFGWHDTNGAVGAEYTITQGNNAYAQEDSDSNNTTAGASPDGGSSLLFDFPFGGNTLPSTAYQNASLTNLFYMCNIMHDVYYQYGFDEANGNFQGNNYSKGGAGGDFVIADGQDATSLNNANFNTPADGTSGRMQMFLWNEPAKLKINSPATIAGEYQIVQNSFAQGNVPLPFAPSGITQDLILFDDGTPENADACSPAINAFELDGKIAVIRRGDCTFISKAIEAQNAGAVAVLIVNNIPGYFGMSGDDPSITIPVVAISQEIGETIITAIQAGTVNGKLSGPYEFASADGSFDNGIVAHEYGHGISNRLAGGPANSSCLNGNEQMGEGWSDWFWLMLQIKPTDNGTEIKGIGTYANSEPTNGTGIRAYPYSTDRNINPFTYASTNTQVVPHGIGSVWGTILWDLTWAYIEKYGFDPNIYTGNGGNNKVMRLVLDGLKLQTSCTPTFIIGRDALIAADQATTGGQDYCMIWRVFAARGVGVGANTGTGNNPVSNTTNQVESFVQPAAGPNCTALGVDYFKTSDMIRIYPNPSNGEFNIRINQFVGKANIQVIDLNGRVVYSLENTDFNIEKSINLNNIQKGIYIVKIDGTSLNYTKKIILN